MDITVNVTSSLTNSQRRISTNWTVSHLKQRLEQITGIPPQSQELLLYPLPTSSESVSIDKDDTLLSGYELPEGARIQVNDTRPDSELRALEDEDRPHEEYVMDDEEYDKRTDTLRHWKRVNQLGKYDPSYTGKLNKSVQLNSSIAQNLTVGSRFRTVNDTHDERRGVIRFIGKVPEIDQGLQTWCGVEFDEPLGKNDGSIKGVYYFNCNPGYGSFLKPQQIEQGDFPELDPFGSDDEI